ncbi:MAG: phosphatase PAP2 family protein [Butyricicoccus sp.]
MAAAIAFSRLYASVHYLTDVLTGAVIGAVRHHRCMADRPRYRPFSTNRWAKMNQCKRLSAIPLSSR